MLLKGGFSYTSKSSLECTMEARARLKCTVCEQEIIKRSQLITLAQLGRRQQHRGNESVSLSGAVFYYFYQKNKDCLKDHGKNLRGKCRPMRGRGVGRKEDGQEKDPEEGEGEGAKDNWKGCLSKG